MSSAPLETTRDTRRSALCVAAVTCVLLLLGGCCNPNYVDPGGVGEIGIPAPINVAGQSMPPIAFTKVVLEIPSGTRVGGHYDGLAQVLQFPLYWQQTTSVGNEAFNRLAEDEMSKAGYSLMGTTSSLFGLDDQQEAAFLLGARITTLEWNTYGALAGNFSTAKLAVCWELMDKTARKVVYTRTTVASAEASGAVGTTPVYDAFRSATRRLLADGIFVTAMWKQSGSQPAESVRAAIHLERVTLQPYSKTTELVDRVIQSVVTLKTESGHASGFFVSSDGYLLTNHHAVAGQHFLDVQLSSGLTLKAEIVRTDEQYDVALLKVSGQGFKPLPIRDSDSVGVGEEAYAVGAPASPGLGQSVTKGIVSGKREIQKRAYIQTDVPVSPGNSGGPLVDIQGSVIGIVARKLVDVKVEGLAFCIPSSTVMSRLGIVYR